MNPVPPAPTYALRTLDDHGCRRWDDFVETCAEATFFHRSGWRRVIEDTFGHRTHNCSVERDGEIVGVLPLVEVKSALFGHAIISN
ncbi:MAG: hypothetical protein ACYCZX_13315, partial [Rhodospirillaceae bacterium]